MHQKPVSDLFKYNFKLQIKCPPNLDQDSVGRTVSLRQGVLKDREPNKQSRILNSDQNRTRTGPEQDQSGTREGPEKD